MAAIKDLSQLAKDPAAGVSPLAPAPSSSHGDSASPLLANTGSPLNSPLAAAAPSSSLKATDAADRGLFDMWENAGKDGGGADSDEGARESEDASSSLGEADSQDGVSLQSAQAAPAQPADYYGIPDGGAAVPV